VSRSPGRENEAGTPDEVTAATPRLALKSRSSVESGPASTFARTRTVPETCEPGGLNVRSRSYQLTSYASWFGVAVSAVRHARFRPSAFHAASNGAMSRSSRHWAGPFGVGGNRIGFAVAGATLAQVSNASASAVRPVNRVISCVLTCRDTSGSPVASRDRP
jgi:hypothetical protein